MKGWYFSTALIIFLKTIVGNSVCLELLGELQLEYIHFSLLKNPKPGVAFMYSHLM